MKRMMGYAIFALLLGLMIGGTASATTYYIAANGSDSNSGTSKTNPWLHAPGMTGCSANCASKTPQGGDSFILRGGDTWHYSSGAGSPVGVPWSWNWSGSSSGCQLNANAGTVVKTGCIYVGVDQTWFSGSSWSRPQMNMDNSQTTSTVSSCTYSQSSVGLFPVHGSSYVIFDNFEILGYCWTGASGYVFDSQGTQVEWSNMYFHGWSTDNANDTFRGIGGGTPFTSYSLCDHNVFDGSDSSLATTANKATGMSIYNGCTEIAYNVFNHVSNGCICTPLYVHDNLFMNMFNPSDAGGTHGNIVEWNNANLTTSYAPMGVAFYNNVIHNTNEGEGINYSVVNAASFYVFNNVSWLFRQNSDGSNGNEGNNCFQPYASDGGTVMDFFNNTIDYPCSITWYGSYPAQMSQNDHMIGYPVTTMAAMIGSGGPPISDLGNELFQAETTANNQGYTPSNNYAPTSSSGSSVGSGANMTSFCNGIPAPVVSAACQSSIAGVTYNTGNHTAVPGTGTPRPSSGPWDEGAYEFAGNQGNQPQPPTGVTATVQ